MKDLKVKKLALPEVLAIEFGRYADNRGYFCETFKRSDFSSNELKSFKKIEFVQANESFSKKGTIRGIHFQWNPFMGKLVRTIQGHMVDMVIDIRQGSPKYGKIIFHNMPSQPKKSGSEWIWVPPGFAHGNFFLKETTIEYYCTGEYNPECEVGISPLAPDIDWSLASPKLKKLFVKIRKTTKFISEKDKEGFSLEEWKNDPRSKNFLYKKQS